MGAADEGLIEEVLPRESAFTRLGFRGREQTIVANLSQLVIVFACAEPNPDLYRLDRFLASAELAGLDALIVANKADLVSPDAPDCLFSEHVQAGYTLLPVSAREGKGLEPLRERLAGKVSAFSGPSGVGKSSLLNALQPGLSLRTTDIGYVTFKGRHTTVAAELLPLDCGGWAADTPGLRQLELSERDPGEIAASFREFRPLLGECRFRDCSHLREPGCALASAAERGTIPARRLESFRAIVADL
jgi:ribosome biogenesis GTPase